MDERQQQGPPVQLQVGEKESVGVYSNFVLIAHSGSEFIIDFGQILPLLPKPMVFARIVMTPQHAQMLHDALTENLKKYEARFGKIKVHGKEEDTARNLGF